MEEDRFAVLEGRVRAVEVRVDELERRQRRRKHLAVMTVLRRVLGG